MLPFIELNNRVRRLVPSSLVDVISQSFLSWFQGLKAALSRLSQIFCFPAPLPILFPAFM